MSNLSFLLFVLVAASTAGPHPASAATPASIPAISGQWSGQVQFAVVGPDGKVQAEMSFVPVALTIRPDMKVVGFAQKGGCRFSGIAVLQPSQRADSNVALDLTAEHCTVPLYNQQYAGSAKLPSGAQVLSLSLKAGKGGGSFEIYGPMRRTR